jgi:hypothetical protein
MATKSNVIEVPEVPYNQGMEPNYKQSEKLFDVSFRENRVYEIYIGREFFRFEGQRANPVLPECYSGGVPETIVNHPDFKIHSNRFNIIEKRGV